MLRKIVLGLAITCVGVAGLAFGLYTWNATPVVPALSTEAVSSGRPFVVKLHAQWCPVCMGTKGVWSEIEQAYADRANLVVWDFTNEATTAATQAEAARLGLEKVFEEYWGATGLIVVVDGRTRQVTGEVGGVEDFATYRVAIDEALTRP